MSEISMSASERQGDGTRLSSIEAFVFRVPLETPVITSFGTMRDRPAVLVRVRSDDGHFGWGEVWCNWPAVGAEYRARLVVEDLAPRLLGRTLPGPREVWRDLTAATEILVLQTGETGPFAQAIAGLDMAIWDLAARRKGVRLATHLAASFGGNATRSIPAYASGIHIADAARMVPAARAAGYRDFKVKVGFAYERDLTLLRDLAATLQPGERLYADANQGFDRATALSFLNDTRDLDLGWMEEPVRVDAPAALWAELARASPTPLAGGENLIGLPAFEDAIAAGHLAVIQPDAAKWGGLSGCLEVARAALASGRRYCPHFLGAGIGLAASAHLLAAAGGDGLLEIDFNPNPLRDAVTPSWPQVRAGRIDLPMTGGQPAPGLGVEPDLAALTPFETARMASGQAA